MSPAVFIDADVPIYAAARDHPYKEPCSRILRIVGDDPESLVTDAEVVQESVHLYLSSRRWALGREIALAFAEARLRAICSTLGQPTRLSCIPDRHYRTRGLRETTECCVLRARCL